jgi:hypothetical protein
MMVTNKFGINIMEDIVSLPSPENWQSAVTRPTAPAYQRRSFCARSIYLFLAFWLIILFCFHGLALPVKSILAALPLEQAAIPACWEQAVRPTFYQAFLEPGMSTSTNPAFLVEPLDIHLYSRGYTAAPQADSYRSSVSPALGDQFRPTASPDLPAEDPSGQASACSIWQG